MRVKYDKDDGGWFRPKRRGFKWACCDCGLVHTVHFRLVDTPNGKAIEMKLMRCERATASMRRPMWKKVLLVGMREG